MSDYIHVEDGGNMTITTSRVDGSSIGRCDQCGEIIWIRLERGELDLAAIRAQA